MRRDDNRDARDDDPDARDDDPDARDDNRVVLSANSVIPVTAGIGFRAVVRLEKRGIAGMEPASIT
ncbi:MAG: hypothetical protein ABI831_03455 [Betaproteobacteria bacterium]